MTIVRVEEEIQPLKYLVITQEKDPESVITTNVVISDNRVNKINLLTIEKGPQGDAGPQGPTGPAGKDGLIFDVLPINSGGTNSTSFSSGNIIYYDGNKLSSSNYSIDEILATVGNNAAITGVIAGSGLDRIVHNNSILTLDAKIGDGLSINDYNQIVVDDTIVRKVELSIGNIDGVVPIAKGGTNNQSFFGNRLLYYDGIKVASFPLETGRILLSGTTIDVIAGSGLTGGGRLGIPSGSVVLNIGASSDIIVESQSIKLSATGTAGTYSKVTTDSKGRVIQGSNLSYSDIIGILGYTPWHSENDGEGSGLDADLLDGNNSNYFLDIANQTGTISLDRFPDQITGGTFTKVSVNDKGIVVNGLDSSYEDIINALGYRPVSSTGDMISGDLTIDGNLTISDNLPMLGTNTNSIPPSDPRGFSFIYGGYTPRTGILAYYPSDKELRLVTNITTYSSDINGGNTGGTFTDDLDGGDQNSIYLINNPTGTANIVLFKDVADSLYVHKLGNENISGIKYFKDSINVDGYISIRPKFGQIDPPLSVEGNSGLIDSLNTDLLDGQHGSYYNDAGNMTGLFDYEKVTFNNLEGTVGYIPVFDNRTREPSRTISDSYIRQTGSNLIVTQDANLFVGSTNSGVLASTTLLVGQQNKGYSESSLAVGSNNIASGNNSIALNLGSKAIKDNSIAAGSYGYTWANNQLSFGAFIETESNSILGQGQYSTIALGVAGSETNGSWVSMSPDVIIPKNKTMAYSLEVLMNKAAGTRAALIVFDSGIIKNSTYRDPSDVTRTLNSTTILKHSSKKEIYNDSQQRMHFYHYQLGDSSYIQNLDVTDTPLHLLPLRIQNTKKLYKYTPDYTYLDGTYLKTNDGYLQIKTNKPISSGWFTQGSGNRKTQILCYNHGMTTGCSASINFVSGSLYRPLTDKYEITDVIDNNHFYIQQHEWNGILTDNEITLDPDSVAAMNLSGLVIASGSIYTNGDTLYGTNINVSGIFHKDMIIEYGVSSDIKQTGVVTACSNNIIYFHPPFTGVSTDGYNINTVGYCKIINYTKHIFDKSPTVQVNLGSYGYQSLSSISGAYYETYCGLPTLGIQISGLNNNFSGLPVSVRPTTPNSGTVTLIPKRSVSGTFIRSATTFNRYEGIYTRYSSVDGTSLVSIYNKYLEPITFPSTPFQYDFVCGYGDTDNNYFYIDNDNNLCTVGPFNYDLKNKYNIRIKTTDMSGRSFEKPLTIDINNVGILSRFDHYLNSSNQSFDIIDMQISNNNLDENLPADTKIGKLSTIGGYSPYVFFNSAFNSFSGVFVSGSNRISECFGMSMNFPTTTLYGTPATIVTGLKLSSSLSGLTGGGIVQQIIEPASIVGYISSGSNTISGCLSDPLSNMFSGLRLESSLSGWNNNSRIVSLTENSITVDTEFSGQYIDSTPITVHSVGKTFVLNNTFNGITASGLAIYSGTAPNSGHYYPTQLKNYPLSINSGICPETYIVYSNKGFDTEDHNYIVNTGHYVTGTVYFYTDVGYSTIDISADKNLYLDQNEDSCFIDFTVVNTGSLPVKTTYSNISGINQSSFSVHNTYLYPEKDIFSTGNLKINLDRNHGFEILDNKILNQVPIKFLNATNNNANRTPVNNLFDIVDISGSTITLSDNQNYLLKEINKPDYFEQPINANYITNGFDFSGILVSGTRYICDCTETGILNLETNNVLGNVNSFLQPDTRVSSVYDYIDFNGVTNSGSNIIQLEIDYIPNVVSGLTLYSSNSIWPATGIAISAVSPSSIILNDSSPAQATTSMSFYTRPYIELNKLVCLNNKHKVLTNIHYNGNYITINGYSTPRSYLNNNDQIKILSFNNNSNFSSGLSTYVQVLYQNDRKTALTGITMGGIKNIPPKNNTNGDILKRNEFRYSDPLGLSTNLQLPKTGTLSFIGSVSGHCTIPFNNNIYYHTYGGSTASWAMDPSGNLVPHPQTGVYTIYSNAQNCSSGTMCVRIDGFNGTNFNNLIDSINRNTIGKNNNFINTDQTSGYVRPWGLNKKLYFDFSDDAPEINGSYYIVDKITPYTLSLNIPYNLSLANKSGLVYIIDNEFNIKSNRNPNLDNVLITSNPSISIGPLGSSPVGYNQGNEQLTNRLLDYTINSYNAASKRWKHAVHIKDSPIFSGYSVSFNGSPNTSDMLFIQPETIKISKIEYTFDYGVNYTEIFEEDIVTIPSDKTSIGLRISTIDGAGSWSNSLTRSCPKVNIYGFGSYQISTEDISFNSATKTWLIPIIISDISQLLINDHNINITVTDESGSYSRDITFNGYRYPIISIPVASYVYKDSSLGWSIPFDIKNLPTDINDYTLTMSGYPSINYTISNDILSNSHGTKIASGPVGSNTGVYYPTLIMRDGATANILALQTGIINVLELNQSKPSYVLEPQGLEEDIYLDITSSDVGSFVFHIPAINDSQTNLLVSFESDDNYTIEPVIEYSSASKRYRITAIVEGNAGYYPGKNVNISIYQPNYDEEGQFIWTRYQYNKLINLTLYRNLEINKTEISEPLAFDIEEPWFIRFRINDGINAYRPDIPPKVRLSNLPIAGTYESQPLEYSITESYDTEQNNWIIDVIPKRDVFGKYTEISGPHTIKIYAEDGFSNVSDTMNLIFTKSSYLDNVENTIYSTPNNGYQSIIDIKQPSSNLSSPPGVSFPGSLKENSISMSKKYGKYDAYFDHWEYAYSGAPILDKWDAYIDITNVNSQLSNSQYSSFIVKCKGIATDKIYAIGKLNLIELDTSTIETLPLEIINLSNRYQASEGSEWEFNFSTRGGLENPNYPPTILLSGTPSPCSGYNPKLPLQEQNTCLVSRSWDASLKKWNFSFKGIPLCNIEGIKPFSVTAIDTDTTQNLYLGYDKKNSEILYTSLLQNGVDHPVPQIKKAPNDTGSDFSTPLTPFCDAPPANRIFKFGPKYRDICPFPTGITGWSVSGSLPPGLNYTISFPGGNPTPPWSNLSSGTLNIYGEPTTFASGGSYPEIFYLTVYDARNKQKTQAFTFQDTSTANPPSPLSFTIYFDDIKPKYTTRAKKLVGQTIGTINASGTAPIDNDSYGNIPVLWPPAIPSSLLCTSRLPHNQCQTSTFQYSGADHGAGDFRVFISGTKFGLSDKDLIYCEFDNNPENDFNGAYYVSGYNNPSSYITIPSNTFSLGSGRLVKTVSGTISSQDLQKFDGTLDTNTSEGLLGCGSFKYKNLEGDTGGYGIFGRLRPGYEAVVPYDTGIFASSDISLTGLSISEIPNNEPKVFTIKTSNCWETGYIRVSGIKLPKPVVELTDPPPNNNAPFTYNNQAVAIVSRTAYGDTISQRNNPINQRTSSINYIIKDIIRNTVYNSGSTSSIINFTNFNVNSGTVISLFINNNPDTFPTYKYSAVPYSEKEYFWIHKAGTDIVVPTQSSFPPVIITGIKDTINCVSGAPISGYTINAIGGYIPHSGSVIVPFYKLNLSDNNPWNLYNYNPIFTGILQRTLGDYNVTGTFNHPGSQGSQALTVNLPSGYFDPNDYISLVFPTSILPTATGLTLPNNYSGTITIPFASNQILNGIVTANDLNSIDSVTSTGILIKHNNIPYNTGDYIDLINNSNNHSTETALFPNKPNLVVISGNEDYVLCSSESLGDYDLSSHFSAEDLCKIRKNYYDQINLSNTTYVRDGEWSIALTGTPTGLYKDYIYKIISYENTGLPAFSGTSLSAKKYSTEYVTHINKPISIILSEEVETNGLITTNGVWSFSFEIDGGQRPVYEHTPEITLNGSICNFTRSLSVSGMKDSYNQAKDRLIVSLSSTNLTNYNWEAQGSIQLKVFDDTGFDTKTIPLNQ